MSSRFKWYDLAYIKYLMTTYTSKAETQERSWRSVDLERPSETFQISCDSIARDILSLSFPYLKDVHELHLTKLDTY